VTTVVLSTLYLFTLIGRQQADQLLLAMFWLTTREVRLMSFHLPPLKRAWLRFKKIKAALEPGSFSTLVVLRNGTDVLSTDKLVVSYRNGLYSQ
jgi:hypothetical protein